MYYEEQVINGVLCHRSTPTGEWIQFTLEELTSKFVEMKNKYFNLELRLEESEK